MAQKQSKLVYILNHQIAQNLDNFKFSGILDKQGNVYPLGTDTKVLSTIFELVCRPIVVAAAKQLGYEVVDPTVQNQYPDFSLVRSVL